MPALLVEAGVLVNRQEEARLAEPQVRARIAGAIAQGVEQCLN
jgi:N-acetylmuramoyl-L-alanine amidase